jgi:hypothetical protein
MMLNPILSFSAIRRMRSDASTGLYISAAVR